MLTDPLILLVLPSLLYQTNRISGKLLARSQAFQPIESCSQGFAIEGRRYDVSLSFDLFLIGLTSAYIEDLIGLIILRTGGSAIPTCQEALV